MHTRQATLHSMTTPQNKIQIANNSTLCRKIIQDQNEVTYNKDTTLGQQNTNILESSDCSVVFRDSFYQPLNPDQRYVNC